VQPVLTPEQMRHVDANSGTSFDVLVDRAGHAVAHAARLLMGGTYGRRVVVVAGKGNNGADGRVAARRLEERGARVVVFDAERAPMLLTDCDLVIDAAYGTGFRGEYTAPSTRAPILAVDIPSGVDALTGAIHGVPPRATATVTFGALKPGLVLEPGRSLAGEVSVVDIGLAIDRATDVDARLLAVVDNDDVAEWIPRRGPAAHKWNTGVRAIAGSRGMLGAARLACAAAYRAGAGIVHLSCVGVAGDVDVPTEVVHRPIPLDGWARAALADIDRFASVFIGPGIGRGDELVDGFVDFVVGCPRPLVIDGDGLHLLGASRDGRHGRAADVIARRRAATILTPHDGEFSSLVGTLPGSDRIAAARAAAEELGAVVLLKGPTTVVADPSGDALLVESGDERLATAGSGDVLTGIIAAHLARGAEPLRAAAAGAFVHAATLRDLPDEGVVASDLVAELNHHD
jgi:NAD(P)H-hydrate epimerase